MTHTNRIAQWVFWSCLAFLVLVTVALPFWFPHSVVDDAYISARYARNLQEYGALTWNIGEDPVEGYTGILLPLLEAVFVPTSSSLEPFIVILGLATFFGTGSVLLLSIRSRFVWLGIPITLLYSLSPFLYRHVFSGMETSLFTFLLALSAWRFFESVERTLASHTLNALAFLLLALARPEGVLFALTFAGILIWRDRDHRKQALFTYGLLFLVPLMSYFFWRWAYYGFPLPNPYYVKTSREWESSSLHEIGQFFLQSAFSIPLAILFCLGLASRIRSHPTAAAGSQQRTNLVWYLVGVLIPVCVILLAYSRSHLSMNFSHRFLAPFFPLMLLLAGLFLKLPPSGILRSSWGYVFASCLLLAGSMTPFLMSFTSSASTQAMDAARALALIETEHIRIGRILAYCLPPEETLVVIQDSGAIPYYSGLRTIDLGRLNDETLAHSADVTSILNDHVFCSSPGILVFTSYSSTVVDRTLSGGNQALVDQILNDPRFDPYILAEVFAPPFPDQAYYEFVYLREDLLAGYQGCAPQVPQP